MESCVKRKKVILIGVFILLFAGVYSFYASFKGNIIRKIIVTQKVKDYIAENYPEQEFKISFATYNFKMSEYCCHVQSPVSKDTSFTVYASRHNELEDDYDFRVEKRQNTIQRISQELDHQVEEILEQKYAHRTRLVLLRFVHEEEIDPAQFELDMKADLHKLPHQVELTVWVETSYAQPTWEEAADLLRELVTITEDNDIDISYFSISVEYPYEDGEKPMDFSSIVGIFEITKEIIKSDELEEYLEMEREKREEEEKALEKAGYR